MLQDREGSFWLGLYGTRPALYNYKDGHLRAYDMAGMEAVVYVNALCEYQDAIWVGTTHGLFAVDYQSNDVRQFTVDQGDLSANGILALVADPQQECLWIGTSGGGVLKYDGQTFQSIRLGKSALENIVDAILRDSQGQLWFGTRGPVSLRISPERRRLASASAKSWPGGLSTNPKPCPVQIARPRFSSTSRASASGVGPSKCATATGSSATAQQKSGARSRPPIE